MTRTMPDRSSIEPAPSQTVPAVEQRWWVSHHLFLLELEGSVAIVDEHGFIVVDGVDEDTATHIVRVHNKSIGV